MAGPLALLRLVRVSASKRSEEDDRRRTPAILAALAFIAIPVLFNAFELLPELSPGVPSLNDEAAHFAYVQRANDALDLGENPVDHWEPQLEVGHALFFFYQHLPHLAVVGLHRLTFQQFELFSVFSFVRYLLLIGFPITVYWSMRKIGFSRAASASGGAVASLLAADPALRSFHYGSYVWRGHGLYTQLWAMHLSFVALALVYRLLERGSGYAAATIALSLLVLAHLEYAFVAVVLVLVVLLANASRSTLKVGLIRLAIVGSLTAVITSYLWLPLALNLPYFNVSNLGTELGPGGFTAPRILREIATGGFYDDRRLPVVTALFAIGLIGAILAWRPPERLAVAIFAVMLILFTGRAVLGSAAQVLHQFGIFLHRFIGGVDMGVILLVGVAGGWVWQSLARLGPPGMVGAAAAGLILLAPMIRERHDYYTLNSRFIGEARRAVQADRDVRRVLEAAASSRDRTFAGLRRGLGERMKISHLHFYDLLTFEGVNVLAPAYQGFSSLNADYIFFFNLNDRGHYDLFNVRNIVAPAGEPMPEFLRPVLRTTRWTLYRAPTRGYGSFAGVERVVAVDSRRDLFAQTLRWLASEKVDRQLHLAWDYPRGRTNPAEVPRCPRGGRISYSRASASRFEFLVSCPERSGFVIKTTYHPGWRVTVDGQEVRTFMVSPSFIGLELPPGRHFVRAEYRPLTIKLVLLVLGGLALVFTFTFRNRFARIEPRESSAKSNFLLASRA